ncbi:hypothetical protein [Streptomyces sp. NPDC002078]
MSPADGGYFMPMFVVTEDGEETDVRLMERITAAIGFCRARACATSPVRVPLPMATC